MEKSDGNVVFSPSQEVVNQANVKEYDQLYKYSLEQPEAFWAEQAEKLTWYKKWDKVLNKSNAPFYNWFEGAKTNIILNAIDRHLLSATRNKLAVIWEGEPGEIGRAHV